MTMKDETEAARREMLETGQPYRDLEKAYERWDSDQVREEFTIIAFAAPFCAAIRKSTGKRGSLEFTHHPRFYFNWQED
jgi:hypothetical protein